MTLRKIIEEKCKCDHEHCKDVHVHNNTGGGGGAVYGLGIFGAAFYFFPQAVGGEQFVMAILKSLVWPALLVYQALSLLKL